MRSPFRSTLLAAALLAAGISTAQAGSLLDLSVVDRDSGQTLPTYSRDGKLYVPGVPGHRYAVRLANRTGARVLAVLSVDGVNAVTGETAAPDQSGYVLDPYESTEIAGWRKSLDEIAQFNFTALPESYAAQTGRPGNVGVIGVAVFRERERIAWRAQPKISENEAADRRLADGGASPPPEASVNKAEAPRGAAPASAPAQASADAGLAMAEKRAAGTLAEPSVVRSRAEDKLGTGHGAREYSHVENTEFERATRAPSERLVVFYDSYANLVAHGVIARPIARQEPNPFPNAFVPDPPRR